MILVEPNKNQEERSSIVAKRHDENCLGCRLVSGGGLLGIAAYLLHQTRQKAKQNTMMYKTCLMTISLGVAGLGLARIFDTYPFKKTRDI